mmetsp:Transcript_68077/g.208711  ORF Transcript_68077/g.208711 Transcript_68077/m.208711 type:complete len:203 (-) Transcript_68077:93-701(-)
MYSICASLSSAAKALVSALLPWLWPWSALKAPIAAPQAVDAFDWPLRCTSPTRPSAATPTCGANMIRSFPLSGVWCKYAPKPDLPAKGTPASPPRVKASPQWPDIKYTNSSALLFTSSGQTLCAKSVFSGVKPRLASTRLVRSTTSEDKRAVGKFVNVALSATTSVYNDRKVFCMNEYSSLYLATSTAPNEHAKAATTDLRD